MYILIFVFFQMRKHITEFKQTLEPFITSYAVFNKNNPACSWLLDPRLTLEGWKFASKATSTPHNPPPRKDCMEMLDCKLWISDVMTKLQNYTGCFENSFVSKKDTYQMFEENDSDDEGGIHFIDHKSDCQRIFISTCILNYRAIHTVAHFVFCVDCFYTPECVNIRGQILDQPNCDLDVLALITWLKTYECDFVRESLALTKSVFLPNSSLVCTGLWDHRTADMPNLVDENVEIHTGTVSSSSSDSQTSSSESDEEEDEDDCRGGSYDTDDTDNENPPQKSFIESLRRTILPPSKEEACEPDSSFLAQAPVINEQEHYNINISNRSNAEMLKRKNAKTKTEKNE